ncbi:MAG: hypothetical protein ACOC0N_02815, partial [Chroococcales cyanobacterium]
MSSQSTSPFKSRLFNFINRQSISLKEQGARAMRRLQVAANWSVQILLYPVYLMVQGGRFVGRQLQTTVVEHAKLPPTSSESPETPPEETVSTPIDTVLGEVSLLLEGKVTVKSLPPTLKTPLLQASSQLTLKKTENAELIASPTKTAEMATSGETAVSEKETTAGLFTAEVKSSQLIIQGIASLLETQSLVLVSPENEVLDILTQAQKETLQQRIRWEVADYYHRLRLQQQEQLRHSRRLPIPDPNNDHVLAPVRWFWKAMRWVQTSPVAIAANLFEESNLIRRFTTPPLPATPLPNTLPASETLGYLPQTEAIAHLDDTVAELEEKQLIPLLQSLGDRWQNWLSQPSETHPNSPTESANVTPSPEDSLTIRALIQAAIDYFFNKRPQQPQFSADDPLLTFGPSAESDNPKAFSGQPSRPLLSFKSAENRSLADTEPDPWLSWDDLYGDTLLPEERENQRMQSSLEGGMRPPSLRFLPTSRQTPKLFRKPLFGKLREYWRSSLSYSPPSPSELTQPQTS